MPEIFAKTLRDLRWQVVWYGIGFALMAALVVFIYPSYRQQLADFQIPDALKPLVGDSEFTSPKGFLGGEFYGWIPILCVVFAIMAGTSALAGEEANGTLDLLLAQPIGRRRLAIEKLAGITLCSFAIVLLTFVGWLLSVPFVDIDISLSLLLRGNLLLVPLILFFVGLSLWLAAMLPDRKLATGVVAGFAVASYFLNYLGSLVDALGPVRWLSVFAYSPGADTLTEFELWKTVVLLLLATACAVLGVLTFEAREISVRQGLTAPFRLTPSTHTDQPEATRPHEQHGL